MSIDNDDLDINEFITEMNNSDQYGRIFKIMVEGRRLFFRVQGMSEYFGDRTVADNLLYPQQTELSWDNEADRVRIIRYEVRNIRRLLIGISRFEPNVEDEEKAESLIISLNNYMTNTDDNNGSGGKRKRKRKRTITTTKSKKSKKSRKSRKSRK